jgi:choline dehydrogenase
MRSRVSSPTNHTFDYVVVGAGSAGCLLANRLSRDPSKRILLLEAGKNDNYPWIHIPVGYLYCIGNPRTDWLYKTEPDAGLNGRSLRYPRGKTLGGCSSINGMIYMRGPARDYGHGQTSCRTSRLMKIITASMQAKIPQRVAIADFPTCMGTVASGE